jgi:NAD(P)-dependent dehydrogenase (short-subunit alcohol dehydrogenase family)
MNTSTQSRVALIIGGRRIGRVVAERLADQGMHIVLTYRSTVGDLAEAKIELERRGVRCLLVKADATKEKDVTAAVKKVVATFGRLDVIVNMASQFQRRDFLSLTKKEFDDQIATDLTSAFLFARAAAPIMRKQRWGRIINITDWTAASGRPNYTQQGYLAYYVAKMGVIGLTEALALELAPHITVNAIAPGAMLPPADLPKKEVAAIAKQTPLGRWGGAEPIADAVAYLCQSDSYVTGEVIRINGGRHLL